MKHQIQIEAQGYYVAGGCSCGNFSYFRNLPKSRGYKTEAVKRLREVFNQHKVEAK
jgi:hypothetical protein